MWGVALALITSSCAVGPRQTQIVDDLVIEYVTAGEGGPVVVLESGLGDGLSSWWPVFGELSEMTRVVAYSRAGYAVGLSDGPGRKRSSDDVVELARKFLDRAGLETPYILVGHSIGGLYVQRFAALYPDEVVGLVLVDGRPKGFTEACHGAGLSPCAPSSKIAAATPPHIAAEIRGIEKSEAVAPDAKDLHDLPVTVIAATEPPPGAPDHGQAIWLLAQQGFAETLPRGRYVVAEGAGHYVHHDRPELVVEEIQILLERVRAHQPLAPRALLRPCHHLISRPGAALRVAC